MQNVTYLKRTIVQHRIPSQYVDSGSRLVHVYLPPGYQPFISYPVVYCQDGEDFFNFGRIATYANQLIIEKNKNPFIVVGVEVDKKVRTSEYSPDGERFEAYTHCFAEEIVPALQQLYPVRTQSSEIILAGTSLGGTISVHLALKYRKQFHQVISLSGAYYPISQQLIRREKDLSWLHLYMIVGLQETAFTTDTGTYNFVELNRNVQQICKDRYARVHYMEQAGQHLWGFWQQYIPHALLHFLD